MRLYDLAEVIRSKNAGPFVLTIDLAFGDEAALRRVLEADAFTVERIAALYGVPAEAARICPFPRVRTIKVSLTRPGASSGSADDTDVYGSQHHFPLADVEV